MRRKVLILTTLFTVFALMCASFSSCADTATVVNDDQSDETAENGGAQADAVEARNSVFTDELFKDTVSAEFFLYDDTEAVTGEKFEEFKAFLKGLELEETEENLIEPDRDGGYAFSFRDSDGEVVKIVAVSKDVLTLSKTESYKYDESQYPRLLELLGCGVSATGTVYLLDPKPKEVYDWTKDVEDEVRNDIFNGEFFKGVISAKIVYSDTMDENADVLEGEKLERFEQLMASLRLDGTDEGLRPEVGVTDPKSGFPGGIAGVAFTRSDGSVTEIEFSPLALQLPDEKCYDIEEGIARKIFTCFGFEVGDDGNTIGVKAKE